MNGLSVFRHVVRVVRSLRLAPVVIALAGVLTLALAVTQFTAAPAADAASASWLYYQRGYYVDNGWLCYGWANGSYHCTHHWHRAANGHLISDHPSWVPNYGATTTSTSGSHSTSTSHTTPTHQAPAPAPAPSGNVQGMIVSVFGSYAGQALAVARCESGYNPGAFNRSSSASGVFQFLPSTWATTAYARYSPFNAWANINAAHQVFMRDGYSWHEWVCQP